LLFEASNVKIDEVFHTVKHNGYVVIFFVEEDTLSVTTLVFLLRHTRPL